VSFDVDRMSLVWVFGFEKEEPAHQGIGNASSMPVPRKNDSLAANSRNKKYQSPLLPGPTAPPPVGNTPERPGEQAGRQPLNRRREGPCTWLRIEGAKRR